MTINAINIIPAKTASCSVMGDYAYKKKMVIKKGKAKKGDLVLFDFNHNGTSDHIGIVVSVNNGSYTTIEGNTGSGSNTNGGQVQIRTRYNNQINYFVRPKYTSKVTAEMAIATARAEVGTVESPKNSNRVKYNTWYYGKEVRGSAYPWCATFICWLFAHIKEAEKPIVKPTGKYGGVIPNPTLKIGSKGDAVKYLQRFLNWYHPAWELQTDGDFGGLTSNALKSFQKTEGITADGVYGKNSYAKASAYKASTPTPPTPKGYSGDFPNLVTHSGQKIAYTAIALAWAKGTAKAKYTYPKGKAKAAFTTAINKVYPKRSKWSAQCRAGASCDVGAGTVIRSAYDMSMPRGLSEQIPYLKKSKLWAKTGKSKPSAGEVAIYNKHIWIGIGDGNLAEANHTWKFFLHIAKDTRSVSGKKNGAVYRATNPTPISKGDRGSEVKKMQNFLKWYGYNIAADGIFGNGTYSALTAFQGKVGLKADGICGAKTIEKMRGVKK